VVAGEVIICLTVDHIWRVQRPQVLENIQIIWDIQITSDI
jgi:hypothetical protein